MFARMPEQIPPSGETSGTRGDGPPLRLLIVGDSAAAGYGVETLDEALLGQLAGRLAETRHVTYSLFARFGSTTARTLAFLQKQEAFDVDLAVVAVGLNDLIAGEPLPSWLAAHRALAAELRDRFGAHVVVSGLPPIGRFPALPQPMRFVMGRQRDRYDRALQAWAEAEDGVTFVPLRFEVDSPLKETEVDEIMSPDGFHPGPRIYAEWAERIAQAWEER